LPAPPPQDGVSTNFTTRAFHIDSKYTTESSFCATEKAWYPLITMLSMINLYPSLTVLHTGSEVFARSAVSTKTGSPKAMLIYS